MASECEMTALTLLARQGQLSPLLMSLTEIGATQHESWNVDETLKCQLQWRICQAQISFVNMSVKRVVSILDTKDGHMEARSMSFID